MSDFNAEDYKLTPDRNKQVFENEIVPDLLEGKYPQEHPTALFLISQPGSGKSRLQKELGGRLDRQGGYIDLDSDLYKPYHDSYDKLMQLDDKLMAAGTRADGREWMRQAGEYARERHINVIVQDTAQNPIHSAQMMEDYREAGYRVEAVFMAVPKEISDQGIQARYYEQVVDRGVGRLTVQAAADQSYVGVARVAQLVDERPHLIDRAQLFRRGENAPCYDTDDSRWGDASLAETLTFEREERPWTSEMVASFREMQARMKSEQGLDLAAKLGPQWQDTIADLDQRAAPKIAASEAADGGQRGSQNIASPGRAMEAGSVSKEAIRDESLTATASDRTHTGETASQENPRVEVGSTSENTHEDSLFDSEEGRRFRGTEPSDDDVDAGEPRRDADVEPDTRGRGNSDVVTGAHTDQGRTERGREAEVETDQRDGAAQHRTEEATGHTSSTEVASDQRRSSDESSDGELSQGRQGSPDRGDGTTERLRQVRQARHERRERREQGEAASQELRRESEERNEPER